VRRIFSVKVASSSAVGSSPYKHEVGGLEEGRLLGQLLDRVAAVAQDAGVAVDVGDRRLADRGVGEADVVGRVAGLLEVQFLAGGDELGVVSHGAVLHGHVQNRAGRRVGGDASRS
jgi:hypothetical protein